MIYTYSHKISNKHIKAFLQATDEREGVSVVYTPEKTDFKGDATADSDCFDVTLWVEEGALAGVREAIAPWWADAAFTPVDDRDWVAENQASFPPLTIGQWRIVRDDADETGDHVLVIKPAHAFGSGEHATTQQCLAAYERLVSGGDTFDTALDVGCGSGILALAAARHGGTRVVGVDIEPPSVTATLENASVNGVGDLMTAYEGSLPCAAITGQVFPLVFANILLGPLLEMSEDLVATVAAGGFLILSGFRDGEQVAQIRAAYAPLGLTEVAYTCDDGWGCLVLQA
ncbi:MAG: 50S ribosomal protein L11 methyltransferase [Alphaproteobacteria bacterium CG_4_10_14_0_8_um_filter_53_9]|nr:MAG: 50S ribosomal protein L11 methyltransferase [Alphaproteobacteria bacterium CG_4_10_14_0_8_um_filter_53_9]